MASSIIFLRNSAPQKLALDLRELELVEGSSLERDTAGSDWVGLGEVNIGNALEWQYTNMARAQWWLVQEWLRPQHELYKRLVGKQIAFFLFNVIVSRKANEWRITETINAATETKIRVQTLKGVP